MAILIAMAMQRYDAGRIARWAHPELHSKPLDAAIGRVLRLIAPATAMVKEFK
jgi:hypothetical protein